ncbi:MAG: type IV pilus assembly protein PilM [Candidatus Binatia bacterium]
MYETFDKLVSLLHIKWPKYIDCLFPLMEQIHFSGPLEGAFGFLPSFLPRREKNYLSLDIGSSSVKMLEVRGNGHAMRVLNASIAQLPVNAIQGNVVQDTKSVTRVIQNLKEEHRVKATAVIASVPSPMVIVKRATFPAQNPRELEETILFEAANFIPESLENVNLDYQVLNKNPGTNSVEVLLVAVRKNVVNSYVAAISAAGLVPVVVDVDYFALENMFEVNYPLTSDEETIALINIGARYTSINILRGKQSVFTSDVSVGGQQLTEALVRELGLSHEQAEVTKIKRENENEE